MGDPQDIPVLDFATIELPSDRATFGSIRRQQPMVFRALLRGGNAPLSDLEIVVAVDIEMQLAANAFNRALGLNEQFGGRDQEKDIATLNTIYQKFDIADGSQTTRQLVRDLEQSAMHLARLRAKMR